MDVLIVNEGDILGSIVIPAEHLAKILLDFPSLFLDMFVRIGNGVRKEPLPLAVGKLIAIQRLQLEVQIGNHVGLLVDVRVVDQLPDEFLPQRRLTLVAIRVVFCRFIGG